MEKGLKALHLQSQNNFISVIQELHMLCHLQRNSSLIEVVSMRFERFFLPDAHFIHKISV